MTFVALLLILPPSTRAHPGKTDRYGGHQCIKDCAEWDLYYREYHLHDKEGRPVRVAQKKQRAPEPEQTTPEPTALSQNPAGPQTAHASAPPVASREGEDREGIPLHWVLVLLFLILLLLRIRRTRKAVSGP